MLCLKTQSCLIYSPDKDLITLRGENRRNMMLSVALLALSAFFYYAFIYGDEDL